jgi:acetylornithine deacetylase/succinyl-diaminopimelate desuccinylase-like protein
MSSIDASAARKHVADVWTSEVVPALCDFIRIPNVSVAFDPDWAGAGHMARAVDLVAGWLRARPIEGATVEVQEIPGRTPVVLVDVPPSGVSDDGPAVLLYGHLDKQPPLAQWRDGLGPWEPVLDGERLYGRGGADDGYAAFAALSAIDAVRAAGGAHRRGLVMIEASEESGSPDLPAHLERLGDRLTGTDLVITLDSWCWSYDRLWVTTSLRGLLGVELTVEVLTEGVHSGMAGGVVPSSFRILRQLLDRVEDSATGRIRRRVSSRSAPIPPTGSGPARGNRRSRSSPPRASRRCATAGTCCGRKPPPDCRSGCRRRATPPPPPGLWRRSSGPTRPTVPP